jgi:hypothetical protein
MIPADAQPLATPKSPVTTGKSISFVFFQSLTSIVPASRTPACDDLGQERAPLFHVGARSISLNGTFMPSERQLAANRRNGRKGGPKTEAGKHRSRLNSLKHGLSSSTLVVLPEEHQHEYEEVLRGFRDSFKPHDDAEDALVLRLAQAHWRSLRSRRIETGMLNVSASVQRGRAREWVENCPEHLNPHEAIGVGFMAMPPEQWQTYLRYDTAISRDFFRTLDALTKLQRTRSKLAGRALPLGGSLPVATPFPPAPLAFAASAAAPSDSGIRSVSQNSTVLSQRDEPEELIPTAGERKHSAPRPAPRIVRPTAHPTRDTPHSIRKKAPRPRFSERALISPAKRAARVRREWLQRLAG